MFVKMVFIPKINDSYVYIAEGYRSAKGNVKHRNIESYGRLSRLLEKEPDAVQKLEIRAQQLSSGSEEDIIHLMINMNTLDDQNLPSKNYGYIFLEAIYNELHISQFMNNYQAKTNVSYSLDDILKLLVFSRCLNPASKKRT